jgi:hypothetical protein
MNDGMEVFIQGLPAGLTENSLKSLLQPYMKKLSITVYGCSIHRKKTSASIFLYKRDGNKFLQRHGPPQVSGKKSQPPVHQDSKPANPSTPAEKVVLMGASIHCRRGNRKPSEFELKSIQDEMTKPKPQPQPLQPQQSPVALSAQELSCGHIEFPDGKGYTFVSEWTLSQQYTARFTKRTLILSLQQLNMEVRISLKTVAELVWDDRGRIAVVLTEPPVFLRLPDKNQASLNRMFGRLSLQNRWEERQKHRMLSIDESHRQVAGWCLVYYISVPGLNVGGIGRRDFLDEIEKLRDDGFMHITRSEIEYQGLGTRYCSFEQHTTELEAELTHLHGSGQLPFDLAFLLKALVCNNYLYPTVVRKLARELAAEFSRAKRAGKPSPISVDAFKKLFHAVEYPSPYSDPSQFTVPNIMDYLRKTEDSMIANSALRSTISTSESLIPILRATVTPTRVTLHGPEMEPRNRVLRKYPSHTDYFMRVQFCDESGSDLFFNNSNVSLAAVETWFKEVLNKGIGVAGRRYTFLGFSHSSLRSHSVWLSAPFTYQVRPGISEMHFSAMIISKLGDFEGIGSPARRAARIGQAFSETPYSVSLDEHDIAVTRIPDVTRNERVFSDGVGKISQAAVEEMYTVLPASKHDATAFQVRWAGAKGMLSLDTALRGRVIHVRDSMLKFESDDDKALEICDVASKPIRMVLNRSVVKILEDMNAPKDWFLGLQAKELQRLRLVTREVGNTAAFLDHQGIGDAIKLGGLLRNLGQLDIDYKEDPFLKGAVEAVVLQELRLLKYKARIPVPQGITLFGVMDETGYLKEGEVFVTYTVVKGRHARPPGAQAVLVTRSPALHPGDIQTARNVIPPAGHPLRAQRNCIFFSQFGDRDLPSQLSGGDLDGDLFNIVWDPQLVTFLRPYQPADYPRVTPLVVNEKITSKHMADFFIEFMKSDNLGLIANRHLILADQRETGTLDPDCIKLAELHSSAVDFSKTGRPVEMSKLPKADKTRPDL